MRAVAAAVFLVAATCAAGLGSAGASGRPVELTITFWPDEQEPAVFERWTLRCNPLGGNLQGRRTACRKLAGLTAAAFAPVPKNAICTEIYGGPQKAVVKGTLGSRRIWASFRRRNGCEIDRWQRFSPWLLPPGGAAS
jgi:hypothetical protein